MLAIYGGKKEYEQNWSIKMCRKLTKDEESRVWSGTPPVDHLLKLLIHSVVCPHLHREPRQALISVCVRLDLYRTWGGVLVFAEVRCFLRSAAWPLAVAVKKPLREWGAWLPVPCLLINDLLLELATNLERERERWRRRRVVMIDQKDGWREKRDDKRENLAQFILSVWAPC